MREWTWDQTQRIAWTTSGVVRELAAKGIKASQWPEPEMVKIRALAQRTGEEWSRRRSSPSRP